MSRVRIPVITGIGVISPLGLGISTFWAGLNRGQPGPGPISLFDASTFPSRIAAEVRGFEPARYLSPREVRQYPRQTQFALGAFELAMDDAGRPLLDPGRTDVIIGAAQISFFALEHEISRSKASLQEFEPQLDPFGVLKTTMSIPASAVAYRAKTHGRVTTISSACTSGLDAIGTAAERIRQGYSDASITGGVDTPITRIVLNAFCAARMLSTENENPSKSLAPFDESATRSVLGEGAAVFILEEKACAVARGARIYAEIHDFAQEPENTNELFSLDPQGRAWIRMLMELIKRSASAIGAINAHGPSDEMVDRVEAKVLSAVFGRKLRRIPVVSIKGSTGSSMGAAGAMQVAASAKILETGVVPPTVNFSKGDSGFALRVSNKPVRPIARIREVLVNAHGIGGMNSAMLLREARV